MGFREGEGLGKYGQGRQEIVEASKQKGRRGLGLTLKGFDGEVNINWQDEPEVIMCTFCSFHMFFCAFHLSVRRCGEVFWPLAQGKFVAQQPLV